MSHKLPESVEEIINELYDGANLTNKKRIDLLLRTLHSSMVPAVQGGVMNVESMVASQSKNAIVIFTWNDNRGELSPVQARGYALQILEASEAATQDAALFQACTVDMKLSESDAFSLITGVRNNRRRFESE